MAADAITLILPSAAPNAGAQAPTGDEPDAGVFAALLGAAVDAVSETAAQPQAAQPPLQDSALALQLVSDAPVDQKAASVTAPIIQPNTPSTDEEAAPEEPPPAPPSVAQPPVIAQPKVQAKTEAPKKTQQSESEDAQPQPAAQTATPETSVLAIQTLPATPAKDEAASEELLGGDEPVATDEITAPNAKLAGKAAPKPGEAPPAETAPETPDLHANAPQQPNDGVKAAAAGKHGPGAQAQTADAAQAAAPAAPDASLAAAAATPRSPVAQASAPAPHNANLGPAGNAVAQEIVRQFDGGNTSFQLRLDPPELGRVDIKLEVSHDKKVTATIAADNPLTMKELISTSRELQRALSDAGLDLADNGLTFSDQRQNAKDTFADAPLRGTNSRADDDAIATPSPARPFGVERWGGARVDVWV